MTALALPSGARWTAVLNTAQPELAEGAVSFAARERVPVEWRSVVVLRRPLRQPHE